MCKKSSVKEIFYVTIKAEDPSSLLDNLLEIKKTFSEPVIIHPIVDFPYAILGWSWAKKGGYPFIYSAIGTCFIAAA